tara:strand:+ start:1134 stop:1736 length:603 start_codon:yes stop_codon:yes gene_type:complete
VRFLGPTGFAVAAFIIAYPLIVYFGLRVFEARWIAIALLLIAGLRLVVIKRAGGNAALMSQTKLVALVLLLVGAVAMFSNSAVLLQYYPVCMNVLMLVLFAVSLIWPPSVIEQIARIRTPDLRQAGIVYTRKVTMVWCGFFALNGSAALYTTLETSLGFWAIYNSLVSYALMGLLFAGEYLVRRVVQRGTAEHRGAKGWL